MSNRLRKRTVRGATAQIIQELWNNGNPDKAALAGLRGSQSMNSRQAAVVWPLMFDHMDENWLSKNGQPTKQERAIFMALRCFAIYQQGNSERLMAATSGRDQSGLPLMVALSQLRQDDGVRPALDRRVQAMLVTNNFEAVLNSLTHLTPILKAKGDRLPIDFADLAADLNNFQRHFGTSDGARRTALKWGQQYFWTNEHNDTKEN